jgi:hypothetical protein
MYDIYVEPGGCSPYPWTPSDTVSRTEFEMFHVIGDPTTEVWTWMPKSMTVTYELATDDLIVTVKDGSSPIEGALVCAMQDNGIYVKGVTGSSGQAVLNLNNPSQDEVTLTVTAHNYLYSVKGLFLNRAPEPPEIPSGELRPDCDEMCEYSTFTTDAEGEDIYYWFDWGDNTSSGWLGPYSSGESVVSSHSWSARGPFSIKAKAKDTNDQESEWSEPLVIMVENTIPIVPTLIGQGTFVRPHKSYEYKATGYDEDDDPIWIMICFSDGGGTGWVGPYNSGDTIAEKHVWLESSTSYKVLAKTKDVFDEESDWAELEIQTSREKVIFIDIIEYLQNRFPIITQILERLFSK